MIRAEAITDSIVVTIDGNGEKYRLERESTEKAWYTWTESGWVLNTEQPEALAIAKGKFIDSDVSASLYSYRIVDASIEVPNGLEYEYSRWVMFGTSASAIGYTFGNYTVAAGSWGEVVTPDDLRYTYLWGTDFKATNGQSYTDEQIQYFIDAALTEIERELDISIKKRKIRYNATERQLEKGKDYDVDESVYDFRYSRIARYGFIKTRQKPIIRLHKLELLSRFIGARDLTKTTISQPRWLTQRPAKKARPKSSWFPARKKSGQIRPTLP